MQTRAHHHVLGILIVIFSVANVAVFGMLYERKKAEGTVSYGAGTLVHSGDPVPLQIGEDGLVTSTVPTAPSTTTILLPPHRGNFAPVTLLHFGDAMFDRGVRKHTAAGEDLFADIAAADIMSGYELRMLNLEGPIIETSRANCQEKANSFQFASDTAIMLSDSGITAVNIANNHAADCGGAGIESTARALSSAGLGMAGYPDANKDWYDMTTASGTRVAILGVDATYKRPILDTIVPTVRELKRTHDVVIVTVHWGTEYATHSNDAQRELAHAWIDAGADVVIGHHPHVIQEAENYKGRAIFYSLGNLIFDQSGAAQNTGLGVGVTIESGSSDFMLFPLTIAHAKPTPMDPVAANAWCYKYLGTVMNVSGNGCTFAIATAK